MANLPPHPRKRLGQHFLIDPNLLKKIVSLADIQPSDSVCEIGPGGGALTGLLCQAAQYVLALEVDPRMVEFLKTELAGCSNLEIQKQDALRYSFEDLPEHTIIVANLPYNISTPIIFRLLEAQQNITRMVLTVQLEVAQRLAAKPSTKDYGVLSVMVQHLADVKFGFKVSRKCFRPVPDVDSGVVRLDIRPDHLAKSEDLPHFQRIVRAAFGQRRKTLLNAFRSAGISNDSLQQVQQDTGISLSRRAETLSIQEFRSITKCFQQGCPEILKGPPSGNLSANVREALLDERREGR
jgi:16S rRNA (adenine1518-N6/adenine1519-N6)-dimethyltransferase